MARTFSSMPASVRHYLVFLILVCITAVTSLYIYVQSEKALLSGKADPRSVSELQDRLSDNSLFLHRLQNSAADKKNNRDASVNIPESRLLGRLRETVNQKIKILENGKSVLKMFSNMQTTNNSVEGAVAVVGGKLNDNVHLFYYPWWGNPETDGMYIHWNHLYIPHWRKEEAAKWPQGVHAPPDDIGSNFFPALGPYSSSDPHVVGKHMEQIQSSGAGVVVVSWYPPDQADENGWPVDKLMPLLLDAAHAHGVKVAVHIEPYKNRSGETLRKHIEYIIDTYGKHPGLYRREAGGKQLPVYYIYDSYQVDSSQWAQALKPGVHSLRGTQYDGIFLGLYLGPEDEPKLLTAGFDGFYTYFAANGFTKGSTWSNWKRLATFATKNRLLFVPSVGPGYIDTRVRPWNAATTRKRLQGKYFRDSFQAALDAKVELISVTSFNEWHEGTQMEQAVPKTIKGFKYEDYAPQAPDFYLQLLREYVGRFSRLQGSSN